MEEQGILEDTIIVFTSDNGMNTGYHGIWGKGNGTYPQNLYDTSVKVPFILYDSSQESYVVLMENLYSNYDFLPTLVDMGHSFKAAICQDESDDEKAIIIYSEYGPVRMIRNKEWKYIHCYPKEPNELYDLKKDPQENHNLIHEPECQERIHKMKWELDSWLVKYVDPKKDATKDNNTGNGQLCKNGIDANGRKCFANARSIGIPYMEAIDVMKQQLARYIELEETE